MQLLSITLGIARQSGSTQSVSGQGGVLEPEIRQKVFDRDKHTCRFCGFQSKKYQDIHFINGNRSDTQASNLATACIYCHQCFDLQKASEMRSAVLVWLPEVGQAELHHIARAIYVARISQGSMAETARTALDALMARREDAKARLSTDDPHILATVMRDFLGPRHYAERSKKLEGIRLLPLDRRIIKEGELEFNQFPQILAYWRSKDGPFGGKIPSQWKLLYAKVRQEAA